MEINEYQKLASRTVDVSKNKDELLLNAVMGLCGESGEVIDLVKKNIFHNHPLDLSELIKEAGDVAWYLAELATALDIDLEVIMQRNIEKLQKRYPEGFDYQRSINREE